MEGARGRWLLLVVASALAAAAASSATAGFAGATQSFPCRWTYALDAGLRDGYVTAGNTADCGGGAGSLTLSARLLKWNPKSKTWHSDRAQTRTWRDLRAHHYVELTEPCVTSTVRAVFGWVLRDTGGAVVARNSVKTGSLKVPGAACKEGIG
jgi:hypothetical protein